MSDALLGWLTVAFIYSFLVKVYLALGYRPLSRSRLAQCAARRCCSVHVRGPSNKSNEFLTIRSVATKRHSLELGRHYRPIVLSFYCSAIGSLIGFTSVRTMTFARFAVGRILLHLIAMLGDGCVRFHLAGMRRELSQRAD